MIKKYAVDGLTWEWDTVAERWIRPVTARPVLHNIPQPTPVEPVRPYDWVGDLSLSWNGRLLHIYKEYRSGVNWGGYKAMHDGEDQRFFDLLERYYQMGKISIYFGQTE